MGQFLHGSVSAAVFKVFGNVPSSEGKKELKLHPFLNLRWKNFFKLAIKKKELDELLLIYPRTGECFLEAPKLNAEVKEGLTESAAKRDNFFMKSQNIIVSALSVLGETISTLLCDPSENPEKIQILERLSDIGKLLTHQHHAESSTRKAFISPGLSKEVRVLLDETDSAVFLYGENLNEKIKEAKQIHKTSLEIKSQPVIKKKNPSSSLNKQ